MIDIILAFSPNVIIGGDFNCHLDPTQDKLSTKPAPTIASVQTLNDLLNLETWLIFGDCSILLTEIIPWTFIRNFIPAK